MPNVEINGYRIHYERAGAGRPLVLLHGITGNARLWQHQLQDLAAGYDVVAWDMRGYGSTSDPAGPYTLADVATDLAGLLDHLGFTSATIGGHAMGGVLALEFYARHPDRVQALILADTNAGHAELVAEERTAPRAPMAAAEAAVLRPNTPALLSLDAPPEVLDEAEHIIAELHPDGYRYAAHALAEADEHAVLPNITVPTLVLWGDRDEVTSREDAESLAQRIPGAHLKVISTAGHLSNLEQPEAFNAAVRRFLSALP
ncbi:MAG: alpha/beta fold hydrolase [Chloroflexi bacterium]|nr:alpha/beta fold hydrolase [Chloroflexota bacterium]